MIKLVLNKDAKHSLITNNISYKINCYTQNKFNYFNSFYCEIENDFTNNLNFFKDIPITNIDIYDSKNILLTTLTFNDNNFLLVANYINVLKDKIINCVNFETVQRGKII